MELPQQEKNFKIELVIGRRGAVIVAACLLILLLPLIPTSESLTLTTYYPAPYGAYRELRATQNSYMAYKQPGNPNPLDGPINANLDAVGIGTTQPDYLLHVVGDAQIQGDVWVGAGWGLGTRIAIGSGGSPAGGHLIMRRYIKLGDPIADLGCVSTTIGAGTTICPGNAYATTTPGIYQPGETKLTQVEWWYQDGEANPAQSWAVPAGSFWCCPK